MTLTMAPRRPARGLSLIDALLAFFVLSTTALVALQTQATLRLDADVARQRAEAVRLAEPIAA